MNETEIYIVIKEEMRAFFDKVESRVKEEDQDDVRIAVTIILTDLLGQACSCFDEDGQNKVKEELNKAIRKYENNKE